MSARTFRAVLLAFLVVQVAILAVQHTVFFRDLTRFPSRISAGLPAGAGSSVPLLVGLLAASAAWARGPRRGERFAIAGLANAAAAGLAVYGGALATGRLFAWLPWVVLAVSAGVALLAGEPKEPAPREASAPVSAFDGLSALFLATLLVPTVYPYVAFDANVIWAWRAFAMRDTGFARAVTAGLRPGYPPLESILLWLGIGDPVFEGRLLPWLLLALFAVFFRARLARVAPGLAAAGLLFVVSTVHVWQGVAMFYADVPLMVFVVAGSLLAFGLPGDAAPTRSERAAGALCLAAAVLVRPDGFLSLGVVVVAVLWAARRRLDGAAAPLKLASAAWATWALRPASLRAGSGAYAFVGSADWRSAGATPLEAGAQVLGIFLFSLQGQWLSHKGVGTAVYLAVLVAAWRALSRDARGGGPAEEDTRLAGAVTFLSLGAVAALYAVLPFVANMRASVAPDASPSWAAAYRTFANVGIGRMTVHLLPFFVLYAVSAASVREGRFRAARPLLP